MSVRLAIIVTLGLGLLVAEPAWAGQQRESLGARARLARGGKTGVRARGTTYTSTYYNDRWTNRMWTRIDRLRSISPLWQTRDGLLPNAPAAYDPIQRIIERRNLLRARSPLAQNATSMVGRSTFPRDSLLEIAKNSAADLSPPTTVPADFAALPTTSSPAEDDSLSWKITPTRVSDVLARRLEAKGEEHFQLGVAYFRSSDFQTARYHFELARDACPDRPRAYLAHMFACVQTKDSNEAMNELIRALGLAKSLEDLRIEGFPERFWPGEDEKAARVAYQRAVQDLNLASRRSEGPSLTNLFVAYWAWLNDDINLARSAAESALEVAAEGPHEAPIRRFRDWLTEAQAPAAESGPAAR